MLKGPIIRINPREVHIADPSYYQQIYTSGTRKVEKDPSTVAGFSVPSSVAATVDHFHHRSRRGYINPYFSKRAIVALEPDIHERISALSGRLRQSMLEGGHISLDRSISAMTADIILKRFYGQHYDYVNEPNFEFPIRDGFAGVSVIFHIARFAPAAIQFLRKLPIPVIRCILPKVANFLLLELDISEKMDAILNSEKKTEENSKSVILESLSDERIPAEERTVKRLLDEGLVLTIAGTETSARALSVGIFYMLSNKSIISRLREEVMNAVPRDQSPDTWTLQQLESLPFLVSRTLETHACQALTDVQLDWVRQRGSSSFVWTRQSSSAGLQRRGASIQGIQHSGWGTYYFYRTQQCLFVAMSNAHSVIVSRESVNMARPHRSIRLSQSSRIRSREMDQSSPGRHSAGELVGQFYKGQKTMPRHQVSPGIPSLLHGRC